ncbi:hypothetical protein Droror1_Dr00019036 [Drosera rotundifolia]
MGRQKGEGGNRTKARPSSSSVAASLLPSGSAAAAAIGVGFGGYVGSTRLDSALRTTAVHDSLLSLPDIDSEIAQHLKRLSMKDPTTKLKALSSLTTLLKQKSGKDVLPIIPQWAFEYKRLLLDYNREVRRATHDTMATIVAVVGRDLAPHVKSLAGPWWVSQFDSVPEVSQAAKQSFQVAFPTQEKKLEALFFCTEEIFTYLDDTLKLTQDNMLDLAAASDELTEMHQQVISSSLLALATLLGALIGVEKSIDNKSPEPKHVLKARATTISFAEKLFSAHKFFLHFLRDKSLTIRSATYALLSSYVKNVPQVYGEGDMKTLASAILGAFQEVHPLCHSTMWEAILLFSKRFPSAWSFVNIQKTVFNHLWHFLRNGCFGSQQVSYPCLVLFLENLPSERLSAEHFFCEFFQSLWLGRNLSHPSKADRLAFFQALRECLVLVLHKTSRYFDGEDAARFQKFLVENILVKLIWLDFLLYSGCGHGYDLSSGKSGDILEDSQQSNDNILDAKSVPGYWQDLGKCLIETISALYSLGPGLLAPFYVVFEDTCIGELKETEQLKRPGNLVQLIRFMHLMEQHAIRKAEAWPLDYLMGPLLEKCFPLIRSHDSSDSLKFLSVAISIFGPQRVVKQLPTDAEEIAGSVPPTKDVDKELEHFLQVFERTFVPWCFSGDDLSAPARSDLLLSLLIGECSSEQWDCIILYATNGGEAGPAFVSRMKRLTMILEKAREKFLFRRSGLHDTEYLQSHKWHHKLLDAAAISTMRSLPLFGDSGPQFIRAVLGCSRDNDHQPFLSDSVITQIYEEVLKMLVACIQISPFHWVRKFGCSLCDEVNVPEPVLKSFADVSKVALFALEVVEGDFCCMKSHSEEHNLIPRIAASILILTWDCELTAVLGDQSSENLRDMQGFGKYMQEYCTKIGSQFWRSCTLQSRRAVASTLVRFIRTSIFEAENFNTDILTSMCCKWLLGAINCLSLDESEEQNALDLLLSPDDLWPLWVKPEFSSNRRQNSWKFVMISPNLQTVHSHVFAEFIDKLVSEVGVNKIITGSLSNDLVGRDQASSQLQFLESSACYRAWLAVEILCTWQWPNGSALATFLPSLRDHATEADDELFNEMLKILVEGALIYGSQVKMRFFISSIASKQELNGIEDPLLRALVALVSTLFCDSIWGKQKAIALFQLLVNKLYIGQETNINCLHILPPLVYILVPVLKDNGVGSHDLREDFDSNSLSENIIKDWVQRALMFPSLISGTSHEGLVEWFKLLISCYPVSAAENVGACEMKRNPSPLERELLLKLLRKQRYGVDQSSVANGPPELQILLSRLIVITLGYCWADFNEEDWDFVLSNIRSWVEAVVVVFEEAVESLDHTLRNASSDDDLELIADNFEQHMPTLSPSSVDTVVNSFYAFHLILGFFQSQEVEKTDKLTFVKMEKFNHMKNQIEEGILRLFLSSCVTEAMANSIHYEPLSLVGKNHLIHPQFWKMMASTIVKTSPLARQEAISSVERWGLSKGPVISLIGILFSSKPVSLLKLPAFVMLSGPGISSWAVMSENTSFSSSSNLTDDQVADLDPSTKDCIILREELSCLIDKSSIEILHMPLEAKERVNVFLAWCLLQSHLLSLPASSVKRERLVQHIQESASTVILDMIFQHVPLELCSASTSKKRDADIPKQLSDIGAAATRSITTGSLQFALDSLWPIQQEKLALLAACIFGLMLRLLPAYVRGWFYDVRDRSALSAIEMFTKAWCSPCLIADELSQIKKVDFTDDSFSVSVSKSVNEVIATYTKDETGMDLVIRLPPSYPLRPVDVECTRSLGISEVRQRKWLLSMMAFVRNQNGALAEAIKTWKQNFDKAFDGVEECPICYSVIHTSNHGLPRLACKTCKHKFHSACLYKWFATAHKSTCPLCQSPF